jgi:DNA-directed RNA polymerase specialized sigma24 family protein
MDRSAEVSELYRSMSRRLEEVVRVEVRHASDPVVEDACQFAWDQLVHHHARVGRETALAWLATTAVREAVRLSGREERFLSLEAVIELAGDAAVLGEAPAADEVTERRERLRAVGELPERQQRVVWLKALGLNYLEMAAQTGDTTRTVERQLTRARHALRAAAA